ncbi:hypothetical protein ES332_D08G015500v1 [Gossypium tomentosum]|uniref:RIN4 pathogenic type III effector avirulence factor Avr cleavage site domain-containing protein n=1 Tax=Gossypium tomentosum TaxID=34277 RepID=A0A5D2JPH0_GOSTO|nr:hypothetical protein ES332_D08G015500v1 [Gossypium tomentosum]
MSNPTENRQKDEWITIPEFGGWERNPPGSTNYSMEFSQARANRKKRKADVWRSLGNELDLTADSFRQDTQDSVFANGKQQKTKSLGNEQDFIAASLPPRHPQQRDHEDFVTVNDKQQKTQSLGNEQDFIAASILPQLPQRQDHNDFVTLKSELQGRANRKQQKKDVSRSLGNEKDFITASSPRRQDNNDPGMNKKWMSVPEFGGWDKQPPGATNYSMVFSQARANRKQQKSDVFRNLGNRRDFTADSSPQPPQPHQQADNNDQDSAVTNYAWMLVPEFRGCDRKSTGSMDYSTVFSKARANRKRQMSGDWRSLGNDDDFITVSLPHEQQPYQKKHKKRNKIFAFLLCCFWQ